MGENLTNQILAWRQELERDPAKRLYHRIAEALLKSGRPAAALDIAEKGLFIHEDKYLACQEVKGAALLALGRYSAAVDVLQPIAEQVKNPQARQKLVMALYGARRDDEGKAICKQLLRANPFETTLQKLMSKGAAALPDPITEEEPLPELVEPPNAPEPEEEPPADEPTLEDPPVDAPSVQAEVQEEESPEPEREEVYDPGEPEAVDVFAAEDLAEPEPEPEQPVEEPLPPEPEPVPMEETPDKIDDQLEGVVLHQADDQERPFDAAAAGEAEATVDQFFGAMSKGDETKQSDATDDFSVSDEEAANEAEQAVEDDPTDGMEQAVDVDDVDVFGDLAGGEDQQQPSSIQAEPGDTSEEPSAAEQVETNEEAQSDDESPETKPKKGRWRKIFGGKRRQKEEE